MVRGPGLAHAEDVPHLHEGHPEAAERGPQAVDPARVPGNGIQVLPNTALLCVCRGSAVG